MSNKRRQEVDPNKLQDWMKENRAIMHISSIESTKELVNSKTDNETVKIIEFEWMHEVYASIYIHIDDIPEALNNAENYFVGEEMFEKACEARDLKPLLNNLPSMQ